MSSHISIERMHESLDGLLTSAELDALQAHLESCGVCRNEHARLREVVTSIRGLPRVAAPPDDAWRSIADRLSATPQDLTASAAKVVALPGASAAPFRRQRRTTSGRSLTLSVPQLAAAAAMVAVVSAATVWAVVGNRGSGAPDSAFAETEARTGAAARAVALDSDRYVEVVDQLERILSEGRTVLAPETMDTIEESLRTVDAAITDVEQALEDDPNSGLLLRMLATHRRTKLSVLERAAAAVRAQT